eukprot:6186406-Pleurochrysis_carterae.AAC.3
MGKRQDERKREHGVEKPRARKRASENRARATRAICNNIGTARAAEKLRNKHVGVACIQKHVHVTVRAFRKASILIVWLFDRKHVRVSMARDPICSVQAFSCSCEELSEARQWLPLQARLRSTQRRVHLVPRDDVDIPDSVHQLRGGEERADNVLEEPVLNTCQTPPSSCHSPLSSRQKPLYFAPKAAYFALKQLSVRKAAFFAPKAARSLGANGRSLGAKSLLLRAPKTPSSAPSPVITEEFVQRLLEKRSSWHCERKHHRPAVTM